LIVTGVAGAICKIKAGAVALPRRSTRPRELALDCCSSSSRAAAPRLQQQPVPRRAGNIVAQSRDLPGPPVACLVCSTDVSKGELMRQRKLPVAMIAFLLGLLFTVRSVAGETPATRLPKVIKLDWAYYNPVSLVLKQQGLLEAEFKKDGVSIEWVQSLGSNKALEYLRGGGVDFGSTAGLAALLGRANGNPIKAIYKYGTPEWTALATAPGSSIQTPADLKGKKVAVTRGTDPHIFLLRALDSVGLSEKDIELVPLQHADGKTALEKGSVDAWSGLDPYLAQLEVEKGFRLFFRNKSWNSTGFLNVREAFLRDYPEAVTRVLRAYERARQWTVQNPAQARAILQQEAKLSATVARTVWERNDFTDAVIGPRQRELLLAGGELLKKSAIIPATVNVPRVVSELIESGPGDNLARK
jgi:sulfonate transport system substrate-binding protein